MFMKNKYTRKQIVEAISYWKKLLKESDEDLNSIVDDLNSQIDSIVDEALDESPLSGPELEEIREYIYQDILDNKRFEEYVFDYDVRTHDDAVKQLIYDIDDYIRRYMEENPDYYDEDGEWDTAAEQQRRHDEYLAE